MQLMSTDRYRMICQMMEFWVSLSNQEQQHIQQNKSLNIFHTYADSILQFIYHGLTISELDEDDTELGDSKDDLEWTV